MARRKGAGNALHYIELSEDRYPWDQQDEESADRYKVFRKFLELGRSRTLAEAGRRVEGTGRKTGYSKQYMSKLAKSGQWYERARAWDQFHDRLVNQRFIERSQQAADREMAILDKALTQVDSNLDHMDELAPEHAIRLLDVALKHRRALFGDPTKAAEKDPDSPQQEAPSRVEVTHLDGMNDDAKIAAVREIMETNQRWLSAASETDDD
ncbi:hypothetical protein FHX42_005284 [Saccharopolyspora lacisalsi]|uniref:Uncharacterized protein n=1 Tax=Halosaccharopolyspora lacisalsi TaxID=1000566 RepID=A0A839E856_9PSEU|nr:hypothetical protein [Halosaccharopolyspora lacisalsi]MBA8827877.1 hypothetical protein [Halosaccharopolyspora lacisalsi]